MINGVDTRKAGENGVEPPVRLLDAVDRLFIINPQGTANFE